MRTLLLASLLAVAGCGGYVMTEDEFAKTVGAREAEFHAVRVRVADNVRRNDSGYVWTSSGLEWVIHTKENWNLKPGEWIVADAMRGGGRVFLEKAKRD